MNEETRIAERHAQDVFVGWVVPDPTSEEVTWASIVFQSAYDNARMVFKDERDVIRAVGFLAAALLYGAGKAAQKANDPSIIQRVE